MTDRPKRRSIPASVKIEVCLRLLRHIGFLRPGQIEWDHFPALELRPINADGTDYDPPQHDPRYIQPLVKADHALKTNGPTHDKSQSDKGRIAKTKRLERAPSCREAYALGQEAAKQGLDLTSNPYPSRTAQRASWIGGWHSEKYPPLRQGWKRRIPSRPFSTKQRDPQS